MKSVMLDTSVLMRLLVQQPEDQFRRAAIWLENTLEAGIPAEVGSLVISEAYFALQFHYHLPKSDALRMLRLFVEQSGVGVSPRVEEVLSTRGLAGAKPGLVDRLIHAEAHAKGAHLATFESAGRRLKDTVVI
jgi:predicted nucleic acid-binding protein